MRLMPSFPLQSLLYCLVGLYLVGEALYRLLFYLSLKHSAKFMYQGIALFSAFPSSRFIEHIQTSQIYIWTTVFPLMFHEVIMYLHWDSLLSFFICELESVLSLTHFFCILLSTALLLITVFALLSHLPAPSQHRRPGPLIVRTHNTGFCPLHVIYPLLLDACFSLYILGMINFSTWISKYIVPMWTFFRFIGYILYSVHSIRAISFERIHP